MAGTTIADIIVPEVFNPYVIQRTMEVAAIFQSGIARREEAFDRLASGGAKTVNMPFWTDLSGEDEVLASGGALTPGKIAADQDVAVILRRGKAWSAEDLAANLAGDDPMRAVGDLVAAYWARRYQATLVSILKGIFASSTMSILKLDISGETGDAAKISATTAIDAIQLLGDNKDALTGWLMHSAVEAALAKQNVIQFVQPTTVSPRVSTFLGKQVITDDGCPVDTANGIYTTFAFGPGAFAYGEGTPVGFVPTETARDALAGQDYLVNRRTFILHPRGIRWIGNPAGVSPTNTELQTGTNWERVYEPKAIRIVAFVHKI